MKNNTTDDTKKQGKKEAIQKFCSLPTEYQIKLVAKKRSK